MKREVIFRIILVLIIGTVLFVRPVNVFAAVDLNTDLWEDQGSLEDIQGDTSTDTTTDTTTTDTTTTNTNTSVDLSTSTNTTTTTTNTNTDIPKAGIAEDTMMIVSIVALIAVAIFTFVKISDYSNI